MTIVNTSGGDFDLDLSQDKLIDDFYRYFRDQADSFFNGGYNCSGEHDYEIVSIITTSGGTQYKKMCKLCGYMDSNQVSKKHAALPGIKPKIVKNNIDGWVDKHSAYGKRCESKLAASIKKSFVLNELRILRGNYIKLRQQDRDNRYHAYLDSPQWKSKRGKILERDNYTCRHCGATNTALHVHHITYERIYHEHPEDLITLCKTCHEKEHASYDA